MKAITTSAYSTFIVEVKAKIREAQIKALQAVNSELLTLYWELGKLISERQKEFGWGKSVVVQLSKDLQAEYPSIAGFSSQNLWRMRKLYTEYQGNEKLSLLVREIGWSHNVAIVDKCKDNLEREFYIKMTKKYGWTKNVLIHQITNKSYEKYLLNQTNFDETLPEKYKHQAKLAIKDEYTFDFLELGEAHSEYELEQAILRNIRAFLVEMGGDFAFIGNQYKVKVGQKEYAVDLLLFNRPLNRLVAIDLKIGEFEPEHKGKMEFYLTTLNEDVKMPHENDAIGIIICKSKDKTVVEYALKSAANPIGVATYSITPNLPDDYAGYLPSKEAIQNQLKNINWRRTET